MADQILKNAIRQIVREEINGSGTITGIKGEITGIKGEITGIKGEITGIKGELTKHGVLLEDLNSKFDKNIDLLTKQMNVKKQVNDHEDRIGQLEVGQKTIKSVIKLHSNQLASK